MRPAIVFLSCALALLPGAARAEEIKDQATKDQISNLCPICHNANNQQASYPDKAGATLMRGAANAAFGWTEMLIQPSEEVQSGGNLAVGVGKGLGLAVKRTAVGFGELLTFWTPKSKTGYFQLTNDCPVCMGKIHPSSAPNTASSSRASTTGAAPSSR